MRNLTTYVFFTLLIGIACVHFVALQWYLYWIYPLLDIPMHFTGGMSIALGAQSPLFFTMTRMRLSQVQISTLLVLSIGIVWELFEWYFSIVDVTDPGYVFDTGKDLVMDMLGGVVGFYFAQRLNLKEWNS